MIKIKEVTKTFDDGVNQVQAVKDVNIEIQKGEIFGIIGFSGAGKSTLIRCINLLERPTTGEIIVNQQNLLELSKKELWKARKKIGMIFQHFNLMGSRTVAGNIAFPLRGMGLSKQETEKKVKSLLKIVDLEDKERAYPSQLSGGQKQRVAIARALANDPDVLLCDEATSALDPQTTNSILKLLKSVNQQLGITIVLITHEMAVVKEVCDRVSVMENGYIVETGDVFKIFSDPANKITKDFISTTSNLQKINELIAEDSPILKLEENQILMQFKYMEKSTSEPVVSYISRTYNVDINILFGDIENIGGATLGGLVVIIGGERENITKAVEYLGSKNVKVEVLKDGFIA